MANTGKKTRKDATVRGTERKIEKTFGLPKNSVIIVDPKSRRNIRGDKKIGNVRRDA